MDRLWISASSNIILPDTFTPRSCSKRPFNVFKNVVFPQPEGPRIAAHIGIMGLLIEIRHTCYLLLKFVSPDFGRKK